MDEEANFLRHKDTNIFQCVKKEKATAKS